MFSRPYTYLQGADLRGANLQEAWLLGTDLQNADLAEANLQDTNLGSAKLTRVIYEPNLESLPHIFSLLNSRLEDMVFHTSPAALLTLREAFKKAGMRAQERQLTYAVKYTERLQAWDPSIKQTWRHPNPLAKFFKMEKEPEDERPWPERLAGKGESLFNYALFELPSGYGLAPGRPLGLLLGFIPVFAVPYWVAVKCANDRHGLWALVPADRLAKGRGKERAVLLRPHRARTWRAWVRCELWTLRTSLYFSLLSAFHLGWRELTVGTWIARLQWREYTLRAKGWVRMVSGLQSLISVYLLALAILSYFGRPFE
jgi:hypothetical protein